MKTLILFVIGLLVVGCGNNEQTSNTNEGNNTPAKSVTKKAEKETPSIGTKAKSPKEIPEEDVIGSYELPDKRVAHYILLFFYGIHLAGDWAKGLEASFILFVGINKFFIWAAGTMLVVPISAGLLIKHYSRR